jgi:hypothetical protein
LILMALFTRREKCNRDTESALNAELPACDDL